MRGVHASQTGVTVAPPCPSVLSDGWREDVSLARVSSAYHGGGGRHRDEPGARAVHGHRPTLVSHPSDITGPLRAGSTGTRRTPPRPLGAPRTPVRAVAQSARCRAAHLHPVAAVDRAAKPHAEPHSNPYSGAGERPRQTAVAALLPAWRPSTRPGQHRSRRPGCQVPGGDHRPRGQRRPRAAPPGVRHPADRLRNSPARAARASATARRRRLRRHPPRPEGGASRPAGRSVVAGGWAV